MGDPLMWLCAAVFGIIFLYTAGMFPKKVAPWVGISTLVVSIFCLAGACSAWAYNDSLKPKKFTYEVGTVVPDSVGDPAPGRVIITTTYGDVTPCSSDFCLTLRTGDTFDADRSSDGHSWVYENIRPHEND